MHSNPEPRDGHQWFKSSYSSEKGDTCVEVALLSHSTGVRDSKDRRRPAFFVDHDAWRTFVGFATEA
ncbi:DUF397 domain-containing protein [Streptomyces sp. NPDC049906]|uniref:DUF397 domain-containing protein n=1 Tax=Streptomyces sp. NPDC049906 TaxID=3155656 RepID=UPI003433D179